MLWLLLGLGTWIGASLLAAPVVGKALALDGRPPRRRAAPARRAVPLQRLASPLS